MPLAPAGPWAPTRDPAIRIRAWDDDASALGFDERSGDTFVIGALGLELLALLDESPALTREELLAAVAAELASPPLTLADELDGELRNLIARGLVSSST